MNKLFDVRNFEDFLTSSVALNKFDSEIHEQDQHQVARFEKKIW